MKFWIARDEDGDLFLYNQKPSILRTGAPMNYSPK